MSNDYNSISTVSAGLRKRQRECMSNDTIRSVSMPRPIRIIGKVYDVKNLNVEIDDKSMCKATAFDMDLESSNPLTDRFNQCEYDNDKVHKKYEKVDSSGTEVQDV